MLYLDPVIALNLEQISRQQKQKTILLDYKSIVFGWTYDIFAHMSSRRLYLNSLLCLVYIFQIINIIKSNIVDAHSAGTKSELMKFGTLSLS